MTQAPKNIVNAGAKRVNAAHLMEAVHYNPETGALTWNERPRGHFNSSRALSMWNTKYAGKPAFVTRRKDGYLIGRFDYVDLLAHRVVWLCANGSWPKADIDHIDGDRQNNKLENLRSVSRAENRKNVGWRRNRCNAIGVYKHKASGLFAARIQVDGVTKSLGYFKSIDEAKKARADAEVKYGFHENHGRPL